MLYQPGHTAAQRAGRTEGKLASATRRSRTGRGGPQARGCRPEAKCRKLKYYNSTRTLCGEVDEAGEEAPVRESCG